MAPIIGRGGGLRLRTRRSRSEAMRPTLRLATSGEVELLQEIEDEAGRLFGQVGLPEDLEGLAPSVLEEAIRARLLWVLADAEDRPIAFALCQRFGEALHLRELDVLPAHMRRGHGRRLVEHVCEEARARGCREVTLTTFTEVPWNAPLYRRWGFTILGEEEAPAWLRAIRTEERRGDLRHWPRAAMRRQLSERRTG